MLPPRLSSGSLALLPLAATALLFADLAAAHPPLADNPAFYGNAVFRTWGLSARDNSGYAVDTTAGTPEQQLRLVAAFGTPYISMPSVDCSSTSANVPTCQQRGVSAFDPASSTTFRNESAAASGEAGASVQLALGSLSAQATLGQDDCTARGPAPNDTYIYPNQTLAVAYASNQLYYDGASQGVLGFGSAGARAFADSLVGHRIANGSLPSFSVGFDYGRSTERIAEDAGEVHWGGISRTATDEPFTWVEVLNSSTLPDWTVHLDGVTFNGKNLSLGEGSTEQHAELEPWFNRLTFPSNVADQMFGPDGLDLPLVNGVRTVACDAQFNLTLTIGEHTFFVDPRDALVVDPSNQTLCTPAVIPWSDPAITDFYRLGAPLFRSVYVGLVFPSPNQTSIPQAVGLSQKAVDTPVDPQPLGSSGDGDGDGGGGTNVGAIVGGVVGGVVGLALVVGVGTWLVRRRRRHGREVKGGEEDEAGGLVGGRPQMVATSNGANDQQQMSATAPMYVTPQSAPRRVSALPEAQDDDAADGMRTAFDERRPSPAVVVPPGSGAPSPPGPAARQSPPTDRFGRPIPEID